MESKEYSKRRDKHYLVAELFTNDDITAKSARDVDPKQFYQSETERKLTGRFASVRSNQNAAEIERRARAIEK